MELQRESIKIKPLIIDSEKEEDVEAWLLNMTKYFQVYEYESNLKARLAIYKLQGKDIHYGGRRSKLCTHWRKGKFPRRSSRNNLNLDT